MKTAVAFLCLACPIAAADEPIVLDRVCAVIDTDHDALSPEERAAAQAVLVRSLEREEMFVVDASCTRTYRVSHQKSGNTLAVTMEENGRQAARVTRTDELSATYRDMVHALGEAPARAATAVVTPSETEATAIETEEPVEEPAVTPDRLLYARIGVRPSGAAGGAFGYRRELDGIGYDISAAWLTGNSSGAASGGSLKGELTKMWRPDNRVSTYSGIGLSIGTLRAAGLDYDVSGGGLAVEMTTGLEWNRTSKARWFLQADATLPMYTLGGMYVPTFVASIGVGR